MKAPYYFLWNWIHAEHQSERQSATWIRGRLVIAGSSPSLHLQPAEVQPARRWTVSQLSPFGFLQVTQVLIGHVLLPPLIHLLRCKSLHRIQDSWSKNIHKNRNECNDSKQYLERKLWSSCWVYTKSARKEWLMNVVLFFTCWFNLINK